MKITLPDYVSSIIDRLENGGFECFIVGGCVRDLLMGTRPHDYDLTTSATPDEMLGVFKGMKVIPTGIAHGTLTVIPDGHPLEITTFRCDGEYRDNRHPECVTFTRKLTGDLSRRDFTVNAMAYSEKNGLVDLFGGQNDIKNKTIRAVGEPSVRFCEDGLRIMRALRFSSVLGFRIEDKTSEAIHKNRELLKNIAAERLWSEFSRLICGENAGAVLSDYSDVIGVFIPEILACVNFSQNTKYHSLDVFGHSLATLDACPSDDRYLRLAAFFHDIGKPVTYTHDENGGHFPSHAVSGADITDRILRRMKTDNATRENVCRLINEHCLEIQPTKKAVSRFLLTHTFEEARRAAILGRADRLSCAPEFRDTSVYDTVLSIIDEIEKEGERPSLKGLAVHGGDIAALGYRGSEIGEELARLLDAVTDGRLPNERQTLIDASCNNKKGLPQ